MFLLVAGIVIIILLFLDFFHTTLSSNGFGIMSKYLNHWLSRLLLKINKGKLKDFSGLIHLLFTFSVWVLLLLAGSYMIFLSGEKMVINSTTLEGAGLIERFYYTCFVLTTLGVGDFNPGNDLSRVLTSILSFSGFVMLTTGMSYLITVLSGIMNRKNLATAIYSMGQDIDRLYNYCKKRNGESNLVKNCGDIKALIIMYSNQHSSIPMIHYFFTSKISSSAVVQLARLYEVSNLIYNDFPLDSLEREEIKGLQNAINDLLSRSLFHKDHYEINKQDLRQYRMSWDKYDYSLEHVHKKDEHMDALLKSAGWGWKDVYEK